MTNIEKYRLFLVFLEMHGALKEYQEAMNSEHRWEGELGRSSTARMHYPEGWLVSAFNWIMYEREKGPSWRELHDMWANTLDSL